VENTKSNLRNLIRERRKGGKSKFDFSRLISSPEFQVAQVVASYRSYGNEPDTKELNELILGASKTLLLPVLKPDHSLEFRSWSGDLTSLKVNGKIEEPIGREFSGAIDLMVIPALAIDKSGNRLGQGGGSYDRTLDKFKGFSVALINEDELVDQLPTESSDRRVSAALTPTRLIRF
jgi:5-formyltetrahydrofolate cyclo-ligase